ncbi:MAG: HAD-IA family hydrolase [Candidatus Bathyarchaeota archaeon]
MIKAVIFDLDGTLVHLPIDYERLFQQFREIMETSDIHPVAKKILELDKERKKEIFEVWNKAEAAALANITQEKEGINIYNWIPVKQKALVTMQGKVLVEKVLERFNLSFKFMVTRENSLNRPEQLRIVADKLKVPFKNVLFVGNREDDLQAANEVGCHFLRVRNKDSS